MDLTAGSKLGDYEIIAPLGSGGMGEVYRARDARLGREIALKILPRAFADNPERVTRFEREARILASLNHPAIAVLHGLEQSGDVLFFVMELVPGETLAERLAKRPLPVEEALPRFRRIAQALEAAHEKGIVHRDLKPTNIKLTPDGEIKLLDFGLASALTEEKPPPGNSDVPTLPRALTEAGRILGTPAYMSPEQARGRTVDRRADIWAFGCCLYEALTGHSAFQGDSAPDTLAKVLGAEPDWQALPAAIPSGLLVLLRRCLQKDPDRRLRDVWDARLEIEEAMAANGAIPVEGSSRREERRKPWLYAFGGVIVLALAVGSWFATSRWSGPPRSATPARYAINLPANTVMAIDFDLPALALSPDGLSLAFVGAADGRTRLYVRKLDELASRVIAGTEGAYGPFYSPDGRWLGFFADGKLKKVSLDGGTPLTICDAPSGRGAVWGPGDRIVLTPSYNAGLASVAASGGEPEVLTKLDAQKGENSHRWPEVLPDGNHVLFTVRRSGSFQDSQIASLSLETGEVRPLVEGGSYPRYAPTGHIVYGRPGALLAVAFDPEAIALRGPPQPLREVAETVLSTGASHFAFSENGLLVYMPAGEGSGQRKVVWVDRQGRKMPLLEKTGAYITPRLSPDGSRLLVSSLEAGRNSIWVYELARGTFTRLSLEHSNAAALWVLNGRRVVFTSDRDGPWHLFSVVSDWTEPPERLTNNEFWQFPQSWSPTAERLAYTEVHPETNYDIWLISPVGEREPVPFLVTRFEERHPAFSPDGRWMAYSSNESGSFEIYVRSTKDIPGKWQISTVGGTEPVWSPGGREIFYRNGLKMMAVEVESQHDFRAAKPRELFEGYFPSATAAYGANYDVSPDGQRFVMIESGPNELRPTQISVVVDWLSELERLAPVGR